ncbi:MAG TPA: hypothetical protein H9668_04350 [Firmicutes bacterium]|nr:hypothetical protein [Bacillota bacterium]
MFGYVKAYKPDMRVREFEAYKAVYCTLCRQLGRSYGPFARLTLSYDFTFLALLYLNGEEGCPGYKRKRCAFNPLKKCNYCKNAGEGMDFAAAAAMIMLYYKIQDNIQDSGFWKSLGYRLIKPLFSHARKKAGRLYPAVEELTGQYIAGQSALEKEGCTSLDRAADPTAKALGTLCALCGRDETQKRVLERLGYCVGKWIYLLDAAADLPDDLRTGSYNPLAAGRPGITGDNQGETAFIRQARERAKATLNVCTDEACKAFELLPVGRYEEILANILYLGLPNSQKQALEGTKAEQKELKHT